MRGSRRGLSLIEMVLLLFLFAAGFTVGHRVALKTGLIKGILCGFLTCYLLAYVYSLLIKQIGSRCCNEAEASQPAEKQEKKN